MIVVAQGFGQLCNRMTLFAHLIGLALENEVPLINFAFGPYRDLFPAMRMGLSDFLDAPIRLGPRGISPTGLLKVLERIHGREISSGGLVIRYSGNLAGGSEMDEQFIRQGRDSLLLLATGWNATSFADVERHAARIRDVFEPDPKVLARVEGWLKDHRLGKGPMVGLHVRRRDYRTWEGGRFFWSDAQYLLLVESLLTQGEFAFVITTDEPESIGSDLSNHPAVRLASLSSMEDLHLLSRCDLLLGPPSTFSTWASFFGGVPLLHPSVPESGARTEDFSVVAPQFVQLGMPLRRLHTE